MNYILDNKEQEKKNSLNFAPISNNITNSK